MSSSLTSINNQNRLFFRLRGENVVQNALISTILTKYNCVTDDIAKMLQTNKDKIEAVLLGKEVLSDKESIDLVDYFYLANGQ